MEELREEIGVKESFRRKLVSSRLKWAGHVAQMKGTVNKETRCAQNTGIEGEEADRD